MIILKHASAKLEVVCTTGADLDCHVSWVELVDAATTSTPKDDNTKITTASTTTILAGVGSTTAQGVKCINITNIDAALSNTVTLNHGDGADVVQLVNAVPLGPGETLTIGEDGKPQVIDIAGRIKELIVIGSPTVSVLNTVVLSSDVTNNNASANTIADVTGLSFSVTAGQTYWFRFTIPYTSAATTTGSRWAINGPASPTMLNYTSTYTLTATSNTVNSATAYDTPAAANATSLTTGNVAVVEGVITPSSNGTVIARFASEVSSSAVVAKAGAILQWMRTR